jgi:large subunit ribosomal protein L15
MPLQRRVPKFGFTNPNRVAYKPVNLSTLEKLAKEAKLTEIGIEELVSHGYASKRDLIKVLGNGELTSKVEVTAHAFSASAAKAIEEAGGKVTQL